MFSCQKKKQGKLSEKQKVSICSFSGVAEKFPKDKETLQKLSDFFLILVVEKIKMNFFPKKNTLTKTEVFKHSLIFGTMFFCTTFQKTKKH